MNVTNQFRQVLVAIKPFVDPTALFVSAVKELMTKTSGDFDAFNSACQSE